MSPAPVETAPLPAPTPEPLVHQPVDDRTLEHTYWQSVKDTTDPAELIAFLEKFPAGTFAALAFERGKTAIDAVSSANVLRRLIGRYPDSKLTSRVRRRLAAIEWARLSKTRDASALEAFASEIVGTPEAELARLRVASLSEPRKGAGTPRWLIGVGGLAVALAAGWMALGIKPPWEWPPAPPVPTAPTASVVVPPRVVAKVETQTAVVPTSSVRCTGIEVDVVGTGSRCLDPSKPSEREFQDCIAVKGKQVCLPMVALPKGSYKRGSEDGDSDEKPVREVTIGYHLAVGKFEVTFAEWDACVDDGGCKHKPEAVWGRDRQPVMRVSWDDITKEYLPWLNRKLGLTGVNAYRLLTEAEWEYAARGVTSASARHTKYSFGDTITKAQAQFSEGSLGSATRTIEVGSLNTPNAFGLHDMHGNVWEWVQDCYVDSYKDALTDGKPGPDTASCSRVLRGGSWNGNPGVLRSADRSGDATGGRDGGYGFRVARSVSR